MGLYIQNTERKTTVNQEYSTWQGFNSDLMEKSKVSQTSKSWHHQTSFVRNVKGTPLSEKEKATT